MSCSTFNLLPVVLVILADKVSPSDNMVSEHDGHEPEVVVEDPLIL